MPFVFFNSLVKYLNKMINQEALELNYFWLKTVELINDISINQVDEWMSPLSH